jgi:hypothetical protein
VERAAQAASHSFSQCAKHAYEFRMFGRKPTPDQRNLVLDDLAIARVRDGTLYPIEIMECVLQFFDAAKQNLARPRRRLELLDVGSEQDFEIRLREVMRGHASSRPPASKLDDFSQEHALRIEREIITSNPV